jgi:hypothetical protein
MDAIFGRWLAGKPSLAAHKAPHQASIPEKASAKQLETGRCVRAFMFTWFLFPNGHQLVNHELMDLHCLGLVSVSLLVGVHIVR